MEMCAQISTQPVYYSANMVMITHMKEMKQSHNSFYHAHSYLGSE